MLEQLRGYYESNGILSTKFDCPHRSSCSSKTDKFTGPKSAFVSTNYESAVLPRLLFLSLDSGSGEEDPQERLPSAVRRQEEVDRNITKLAKGRHWYRTHELAWYILSKFDKALQLEQVKHYFAHANSAKCCMNKDGHAKANSMLFKNCKQYLGGELDLLMPDIVVTQGNEARTAMGDLVSNGILKEIDAFAAEVELNKRPTFWLHTYHPSNYGAFNKQRDFNRATRKADGWERYASFMANFIQNK